ncbi:MAG: GldG family protein [Desulfovibrionaceae bacterium]|jgi:ABC-type uncharacterized transport system involved in gliding motility auxiliary subunit|nr:GldG family protein [Desulfovibrionaceae bacterium]
MRGAGRYSTTVLAALIGLAVLVGLNVLAARSTWRWDATADRRNSLSRESADVLAHLPRPVSAVAFYRPQEPEAEVVRELFERIAEKAHDFTWEFADPDRSPFKAREYGVRQSGTVVLSSGDKRESVLFADEEKLVNAMVRVSDPAGGTVYFVTGHGELDAERAGKDPDGKGSPDSCVLLAKALREKGLQTRPLLLAREREVPEDASAVLVLGAQRDFLQHELDLLARYVGKGGRLLVALEPESATNLDGFLADHFGVTRLPGFVVDPVGRMIVGDPMAPLVRDYSRHPITRDFELMTLFPTCGALEMRGAGLAGGTVRPLGSSSAQAWLETDVEGLRKGKASFDKGVDTQGPLRLAMAWQPTPGPQGAGKAEEAGNGVGKDAVGTDKDAAGVGKDAASRARAVVFADQDFLADRYAPLSGNLDLARNSVQWLLEKEGLITVSKPKAANVFLLLTPGQRAALTWVPLAGLPLGALALAALVALRRRRG